MENYGIFSLTYFASKAFSLNFEASLKDLELDFKWCPLSLFLIFLVGLGPIRTTLVQCDHVCQNVVMYTLDTTRILHLSTAT